MPNHLKKLSVVLLLLLTILLLTALPRLGSNASPAEGFLPTPVPPEPYPFSDRYPAVVYIDSLAGLQTLYEMKIDFEGLHTVDGAPVKAGVRFQPSLATVYVSPDEAAELAKVGLEAIPIPNEDLASFDEYGPGSDSPDAWPSFEDFVARMQGLETSYPVLVEMISIGTSVQGRDIWCLKLSDNVSLEENEPEFKYSSTMHGGEVTGVEMILRLAELLLENYDVDPELTELVDEIEIWLCPIHNPDGFVAGSRYNANGYDLNRNFPDRFTGPSENLQIENQAFITLGEQQNFVMGANYHGGTLVVNYPWDAVAAPGDLKVPIYAPDDTLYHDLGLSYTISNTMMYDTEFPEGLTRGWEWYPIWGGMQDYLYVWNGEHHVTIEVSVSGRPPYTEMDNYWENNRESMLRWMRASLTGVRGLVLDARSGSPLEAVVTVDGMAAPNFARTDPSIGDYHRVIDDGDYTLTASVDGYQNLSHAVSVMDGAVSYQDFLLCPTATWVVSGTVTQSGSGLPLQATLEFLGSPQKTSTDPFTGDYSLSICPGTYTLRASTPNHYPQERSVVVDQDLSEDFVLVPFGQAPDMSGSSKAVSSAEAVPGEVLEYQVVLLNSGAPTTATLTDTLPLSLTWAGELTATLGVPSYEDGQILWQGAITSSAAVTVTYTASPVSCLPEGTQLTNVAVLRDHYGVMLERSAVISILNDVPGTPGLLAPAQGALDQPLQTSLSWSDTSDPNCDLLTYNVYFGDSTPPPLAASGLLDTTYTPAELLPHTTYYWSVSASDGSSQSQSEVWQFTTLNHPPDAPVLLTPADGALDQPLQTLLSWSGSDPDGDALTYTLTLWAEDTQPISITGLTGTEYDPGILQAGVKYYWQLSVWDGLDATSGSVWSFTTQEAVQELLRAYLPLARKTSNQEP